ncbi:UNKNOWN [Stylonychia lemnae]|uniref:Uncharacterized protein n=1 Tax=Stylonychia lemnae TaxID=5949 RepID=A0A078AW96_STYLE|nr:UNKNOWN [Stylonychia lemnae]|eukprot:CDW85073.1 UNKNOWN [Stylonychia lemnae]
MLGKLSAINKIKYKKQKANSNTIMNLRSKTPSLVINQPILSQSNKYQSIQLVRNSVNNKAGVLNQNKYFNTNKQTNVNNQQNQSSNYENNISINEGSREHNQSKQNVRGNKENINAEDNSIIEYGKLTLSDHNYKDNTEHKNKEVNESMTFNKLNEVIQVYNTQSTIEPLFSKDLPMTVQDLNSSKESNRHDASNQNKFIKVNNNQNQGVPQIKLKANQNDLYSLNNIVQQYKSNLQNYTNIAITEGVRYTQTRGQRH